MENILNFELPVAAVVSAKPTLGARVVDVTLALERVLIS